MKKRGKKQNWKIKEQEKITIFSRIFFALCFCHAVSPRNFLEIQNFQNLLSQDLTNSLFFPNMIRKHQSLWPHWVSLLGVPSSCSGDLASGAHLLAPHPHSTFGDRTDSVPVTASKCVGWSLKTQVKVFGNGIFGGQSCSDEVMRVRPSSWSLSRPPPPPYEEGTGRQLLSTSQEDS